MNEPIKLTYSWPYPRGLEYKMVFEAAELSNNIPSGLLARVGWQESKFRPDIIKGDKISSAGAVGIMQIIRKYHPKVEPLNPLQSIDYAASYLRELHNMFGTWELALAAYNWGPGNLMNCVSNKTEWPAETIKYTSEILADAFEILALHTRTD